MKICAVDIGSNAMRAVIATVHGKEIHFNHNMRWPLRLGADVFASGAISPTRFKACEDAFGELFLELARQNVTEVRAVATSAMRESKNGQKLVKAIKAQTGIDIKVITGSEEATIISSAVTSIVDLNRKLSLLIDVGGGSTEISLIKGRKMIASKSFNFGAVRMLQSAKEKTFEKELNLLAKKAKRLIGKHYKKIEVCVGTGGNLRRMGKLRQLEFGRPSNKILFTELEVLRAEMVNKGPKKRIKDYQMRADRADIIIFAMGMIETLMTEFQLEEILLPKVGLKEGLVLSQVKFRPEKIHLQTKNQ